MAPPVLNFHISWRLIPRLGRFMSGKIKSQNLLNFVNRKTVFPSRDFFFLNAFSSFFVFMCLLS